MMFRTKKYIYSELSPPERIPKIIREFIYPVLESHEFKILKSGLTIKRERNGFVQEIWFSKSFKGRLHDQLYKFESGL